MQVIVALAFDAAHRIQGHPGKCGYLHGHTYHLETTVNAAQLDPLGMVMDVDDLKAIVKKTVVDRWDHGTLLWTEDPLATAITRVQAEAPERVVCLPANPTVEILAREAWEAIGQSLPRTVALERIVLWETPTCAAEITRHRP